MKAVVFGKSDLALRVRERIEVLDVVFIVPARVGHLLGKPGVFVCGGSPREVIESFRYAFDGLIVTLDILLVVVEQELPFRRARLQHLDAECLHQL